MKTEYSIKDKVFVVTGATKGLGLASCKRLLNCGAKIIMVYHTDTKNAKQVAADLKQYQSQMLILQADITKAADRQIIINEGLSAFQQINVLVNNAGVSAKNSFLKDNEEDFNFIMDVNLKAPIFLAQAVAKQMIKQGKGGSIINISSVCGHRAMGSISYDTAKAGLIRASQAMANALGQHRIRVNSISPGAHKTEMNRQAWESKSESWENFTAVTALKRGAEADEMAGTVLYLASEQSSYTTGIDIIVDGGYLSHCPGRGK